MNLLAVSSTQKYLFIGSLSRIKVYTLLNDGTINFKVHPSTLNLLNNEVFYFILLFSNLLINYILRLIWIQNS